jgi:L-rhamnose-H+ transport protein
VSLSLGFTLILFAAVCGGAFAVPLKRRRKFALENIYVLASLLTMVVIPLLVASFSLPDWPAAIRNAGGGTVTRGLAYGFAWGVGAVTFGYGVSLAGLSIGYATIMGINTAVGSLLPFLVKSPRDLFTPGGLVILTGIFGCIGGVAICGRAGSLRESSDRANASTDGQPKAHFLLALLICLISGVLSACANLGFAFTSRIAEEAQKLGATPVIATLGSWLPVYWGGFAANLIWFGAAQIRNGSWRYNFAPGAGHDWWMSVLMGTLWFLAMIPYGMGAYYLGRLGTSVGWAISIASSLLVANIFGFITGEWKGAPRTAILLLSVGLGLLVAAMAVLGLGNSMLMAY